MAYLVFNVNGRELGRRKLDGPLVIGRAADCDICVHDILLSRQHCQVEPAGAGWAVVDLASKNGTYLASAPIRRVVLADGQQVRIGKTLVTYHAGKFTPAPKVRRAADEAASQARPADPWAALADSVSGLQYLASRAAEKKSPRLPAATRPAAVVSPRGSRPFPRPQPAPRVPRAYEREDVYGMLSGLASSSWDSIYLNNTRPIRNRPAPRPIITTTARHSRRRGQSAADLATKPAHAALSAVARPASPERRPTRRRWNNAFTRMVKGMAVVGQTMLILGIVELLGRV